jgi:MFS family permease
MLRNRVLLAISFAVFAAYVGTGMVVPVRVLYAEERGASLEIIAAMATSFLISNFIFQFPMGWIADRWGRKRIMVAGLVAQAAISLAYLYITDPFGFVGLRFIEGIASATMLSPARALIADTMAPEKRGEAYGVFNAFFNASFLIGPGIGSWLAELGYEMSFVAAAATRLLALVIVILVIAETVSHRDSEDSRERPALPLRKLFSLPLIGAYILVFGDYLYLGFELTLFPLWMQDHLGASIGLIGLAYIAWGIPMTILSPLGGRIADRVRRSWLMLIMGGVQVPIYIVYGLLDEAWPVVALGLLHGAVYAMMQPAVDAHLAASSMEEARARVQGLYSSVGLAGAFVGANGLTTLYETDYRLPLFVMGVGFGVCVLIGGLIVRLSEARGLVAGPGGRRTTDDRRPERET